MLQLHQTKEGQQDYAEFLHAPRKKFTDFGRLTIGGSVSLIKMRIDYYGFCFNMVFLLFVFVFAFAAAVRKEIQDETDRMTGKSKQISNIPIHLSIYSPNGSYFQFHL